MAHDVFLTYSSDDRDTAVAACEALEREGVRVWMAPRDIVPGADWPGSIIAAINGARAMVLIFSTHANESPQVKREVERAVNRGIPIIPFRIEDILPSPTLEYLISAPHWLDAFTPGPDEHFPRLVDAAKHLIAQTPAAAARPQAAPAAAERAAERPAYPEAQLSAPAAGVRARTRRTAPTWATPRALGAAGIAGVVVALLIGLWLYSPSSDPPASQETPPQETPTQNTPSRETPPPAADPSIDRQLAEIRRQPLLGYNLETLPESRRTITIAVLSTGVSPELAQALDARVQASSAVPGEPDPEDLHGLGTSSVALVAALAPAAKIHAIKIYSAQGSGLTRPAEDGIRKAVQDGANVIFMDCCGNAGSEGLTTAVEAAVKAGILVAAPAGNEKQTELPLPAALDGVMAVAALGPDGKPAAFTNRDASVLFAPGVEIATIDDRMAPTRLSGTSLSATIASAIAAVVWAAKPGWSAQQIRRLLADTAVDIGPLDARRPTAGRIRRLDLAAAAAAPAGAVDAAARECARDCRRTFSDCNMNTVNDATSTSRDACQAQLKACVAACGQR